MDILNNLASYFDAKEILHQNGGEILIDATSTEMLETLNISHLKPDYIKIFWHALMEEYQDNNAEIKKVIDKKMKIFLDKYGN